MVQGRNAAAAADTCTVTREVETEMTQRSSEFLAPAYVKLSSPSSPPSRALQALCPLGSSTRRLISTTKMLRHFYQTLCVLPPASTNSLLWISGFERCSRLRPTIMIVPKDWAQR